MVTRFVMLPYCEEEVNKTHRRALYVSHISFYVINSPFYTVVKGKKFGEVGGVR